MAEPQQPGQKSDQKLPDHVTLPLLTLITQQSLEQDYQVVADRRARMAQAAEETGADESDSDQPERRTPRHVTAAVVAGVFGLLIVIAFVQTERNATADETRRATLISKVTEGREQLAASQRQIGELREENAALAGTLERVAEDEQAAEQRLRRLEVRTGHVAVRGPGVRVTVGAAPSGNPEHALLSYELAALVDGLWNAGAEAISVNGVRLTSLSAFYNTGLAVYLSGEPRLHAVSAPYTILAIGDTRSMQSRFADTSSGLEFLRVQRGLELPFDMEDEESLSLPAAQSRQLRHVQPYVAGVSRSTGKEATS